MIKLKRLIENKGKVPVLYHLTRYDLLPVIKDQGLRPTTKPWVYLTDVEAVAANYCNLYDKGTEVVLLKINPKYLDITKFGPDDDDLSDILNQRRSYKRWYEISWNQSLKLTHQMTYEGVIPPAAIKVIDRWTVKI
jgi:hypothetical protein